MKTDDKKTKTLLNRGVVEIINRNHLEKELKSGRKLRVKLGIDPTLPDLHLGHAVVLRKLKQFQDAGHKAILVIGDFTAQIGDPSGRSAERVPLTKKEIQKNLKKYLVQAGKIIDIKKTEIKYNSHWLEKNLDLLLEIARVGTVQQVLKRADFKKRLEEGGDVTFLEVFYSLFQGYDSVAIKANIELGGTDQKFNLLMGRRVQRYFSIPEQNILTMELLEGTDGVKKMSKSFHNYIALDERPEEIFGKVMKVPDKLIKKYFTLLTDINADELGKNVFEQKKLLAKNIVEQLYSKVRAESALLYFEKTFSNKEIPADAKIVKAESGEKWENFLVRTGIASSKAEARRLVKGGGVDFKGRKIFLGDTIKEEGAARIGKHLFIKLIFG